MAFLHCVKLAKGPLVRGRYLVHLTIYQLSLFSYVCDIMGYSKLRVELDRMIRT